MAMCHAQTRDPRCRFSDKKRAKIKQNSKISFIQDENHRWV